MTSCKSFTPTQDPKGLLGQQLLDLEEVGDAPCLGAHSAQNLRIYLMTPAPASAVWNRSRSSVSC